jgi:spore maturation protein SpmB
MLLNVSANMLGLGNAATPFGIKAMVELDRLNPFKGTATNAMCLFLAINTSSITILPLGVIGVRAAAGASNPAEIFLPTIIATLSSTLVAVIVAGLFSKADREYRAEESLPEFKDDGVDEIGEAERDDGPDYSHLKIDPSPTAKLAALITPLLLLFAAISAASAADDALIFLTDQFLTYWLMPLLMLAMICFGVWKGVKVYEAVTEGAKQGFDIAIRIIPFLVAILVAIAMFRASGAMELLTQIIGPYTNLIGMPPDALPMALVRPLSGSGAFGVMSALVNEAPNSYEAYVASTMMGSTETTFYVLAVYFGAIGVTRIRHAMIAALAADFTGIIVSCTVCQFLWNG